MRLKSVSKQIAVAAAMLMALAGCGGEEADTAAPDDAAAETAQDAAADSDWPSTLVFAGVPAEDTEDLVASWEPFFTALGEELGIEVEIRPATDYAGVIEGQIAGRVDLAQYGPFAYVIARNQGAEIEALAAATENLEGIPGYHSLGITAGDNDEVDSIEDFAGKTVCFVDPSSTSGFLFPTAGLLEAGIDPDADIEAIFAGGHDTSVLSVARGDCEVGFADDETVYGTSLESGDIEEGDVKEVWESGLIPASPLAVRSDLPEDLKDAIREAVLMIDSEFLASEGLCGDSPVETLDDGAEVCRFRGSYYGFTEVDDSFYDDIRAVCDAVQTESCQEG